MRRNKPIFTQLLQIIILCTFCTLALFATGVWVFYRNNVSQTLRESRQQVNHQLNQEYSTLYQQMIYIVVQLSTNNDIQGKLTHVPEDQFEHYTMMREVNEYLQTFNGYFSFIDMDIFLHGQNGMTYSTALNPDPNLIEKLLQENFVQQAMDAPRKITLLPNYPGLSFIDQETPYFCLLNGLRNDYTGRNNGMVMLMLNPSCFRDRYVQADGEDDQFILLTEDGFVVSASVASLMQRPNSELLEIAQNPGERCNFQGHTYLPTVDYNEYFRMYLLQLSDTHQIDTQMQAPLLLLGLLCMAVMVAECMLLGLGVRRMTQPIAHLAVLMNGSQPQDIASNLHQLDNSLRTCKEADDLIDAFEHMSSQLAHYIAELLKVQEAKRMAELNALQYQINPHFMYNTLTSMKYVAEGGQKDALYQSIDNLIRVLRMTLGDARSQIPLKDEAAILQSFFEILQLRYAGQVHLSIHLPPDCENLLVPRLILQPIVENAVFHAFTDAGTSGTIDVFIARQGDLLHMEVMDNGQGIPQNVLQGILTEKNTNRRTLNGIGLSNVHERLHGLYGLAYGLTIESQVGYGTQVTVELPAVTAEEEVTDHDDDHAGG